MAQGIAKWGKMGLREAAYTHASEVIANNTKPNDFG